MIRLVLNSETINSVVNYEEDYLTKCSRIIESYMASYANYGCKINYGLFWKKKNKVYKERPLLENGYECWFDYAIEKNGQLVCCDEVEGDSLGMGECFLYVCKKRKAIGKNLLEVVYIDEVEDLRDWLEKDLSVLINSCKM